MTAFFSPFVFCEKYLASMEEIMELFLFLEGNCQVGVWQLQYYIFPQLLIKRKQIIKTWILHFIMIFHIVVF